MANNMFNQLFSRVTSTVQSKINNLTKWTLKLQNVGSQVTQKTQSVVNKYVQALMDKPKSKNDYWRFLGIYFSKRFVVMFLAGIGASIFLYVNFLLPLLEGKFWAAKLCTNMVKYQQFSGKAKVRDTGGVFIYEGEMNTGKPHGFGIQYSNAGVIIYKGNFVQGQYNGNGELYDKYGNIIYTGEFKDNKFEGSGKQINSFGKTVFIGNFSKGERHGRGNEYDAETGLKKYYGEFSSGKYNGTGIKYDPDGETVNYIGEFKEGVYSGKGKEYHNGHLIYDGEFINNVHEGSGISYDESSRSIIYSGDFINNLYNGSGTLYDISSMRIIYSGEFKDGKREGEGISYDRLGTPIFSGKFLSDGIDYVSILGNKIEDIIEKFGQENTNLDIDDKKLLIYLNFDAAMVLKSEDENFICERVVLGTKEKFMGLDARSTSVERRNKLGKIFSSTILKSEQFHQKAFQYLKLSISDYERMNCEKYIYNKYFIRIIFSSSDSSEFRAFEIGNC
ncbi:MAG: hypothetical protein LBJ32_03315 [Oscillospiraceae bacterium]|nr:hypothetical protein [Oscillospiraceae bacterium]